MNLLNSTVFHRARLLPTVSRIFGRLLSNPLPSSTSNEENSAAAVAPKPFSEIPGVKGLPILGTIFHFVRDMKEQKYGESTLFAKYQSEFGPIYKLRLLGNKWNVVIASPEAIEAVFRAEGKLPARDHYFEDNMMWIYRKLKSPPPMFFAGGEVWKNLRSAGSKQVIPRRVGNFVGPLSDIADELLAHLDTIKDKSGNVLDMRPELNKWAFQGVSYFVYGEKINIYSGTDPLLREFLEAGTAYIRSIGIIGSALPLYKLYPTKAYRDYEKIVRRMQKAGKQILDRRYNEIKDVIESGHVDETKAVGLLDQWLIEGKYTEEEALSQSYDMLSAGIDTTTNTTALLIYEIAKQPELQERLVQEITSVVGDKKHPSWDDLQKMTLVRNCVKETLRLYYPIGVLPRVLADDAVLLGYHVPAGTTVYADMSAISRNSEIFKDPKKFNPDRWNKNSSEEIHPFSSLPFGFGPRSCYGRRLAELEMYVLLSEMLPKYRITTNVKDMKLKLRVVVTPDLPLHINFQER